MDITIRLTQNHDFEVAGYVTRGVIEVDGERSHFYNRILEDKRLQEMRPEHVDQVLRSELRGVAAELIGAIRK